MLKLKHGAAMRACQRQARAWGLAVARRSNLKLRLITLDGPVLK
jgi:hypothetical protein